jgi:hypothetical protein
VQEFDVGALHEALDAERIDRGLTWRGVADELWNLSAELNARRYDHPISPSTLKGMANRGATSCQHALFMLRWLGRTPESFLPPGAGSAGAALPIGRAGPSSALGSRGPVRSSRRRSACAAVGLAGTRSPASLHPQPTHRASYRTVRDRHEPRDEDRAVAGPARRRLHLLGYVGALPDGEAQTPVSSSRTTLSCSLGSVRAITARTVVSVGLYGWWGTPGGM